MSITTAHDPITDLEAATRALAEGHDPTEVAARLHGIAERLRGTYAGPAEDERWDICRLIVKRMDAMSSEEVDVVRRNLPRADAVLAMQSIANNEHIGPVKVGDVVAWADVPDGALVKGQNGYHTRIVGGGRLVGWTPQGVPECWAIGGTTWAWGDVGICVTIVALGLTGQETADDLRRTAEDFERGRRAP
jgi:hypothetical protein